MRKTSSFSLGGATGPFKYLFFVLLEDYTDLEQGFVKEFRVDLERLARDMGSRGAVVEPFLGDIETTRAELLDKAWTEQEAGEVVRVPSLLVINKDFDDFSPRSDPWIIFHFDERRYGGHEGRADLRETFRAIVAAVASPDSERDLYSIAQDVASQGADFSKVFGLRPGLFGFSIDILAAGQQIRDLVRSGRRPFGREGF